MGDWPLGGGGLITEVGAVTASTTGTAVTSAGSANIKGSWTPLTTSVPFTCSSMYLVVNFLAGSCLMDIGIGADGSEQVVIADIHNSTTSLVPTAMHFPIRIPQGVQLKARIASTVTATSCSTIAYLISEGYTGAVGRSRFDTYGATSADSGGTSVDPGGTLHTKGSWVPLTTSTTTAHKRLAIAIGNQANTAAAGATYLFDVGVGPAASERVLLSNYRVSTSANETVSPQFSPFFPVDIPAGSRLSVRSQANITDATDRLLDAVLYTAS